MQIIVALLVGILASSSINVAGTWTGEIKEVGATDTSPAYLQLNQEKDKITGVTGPSKNVNFPLKHALLVDDKLSFSVHSINREDPKEGADWTFDLKVTGDTMEGTARGKHIRQSCLGHD